MTAGMHHYHARSYQLTCRGEPKRARLDRHYQTVGPTTLWSSGGWTFSKCLVVLLECHELSFLRGILQVPRLPGEGFVEYMKRSASVCRQVLVKYRLQGIVATALTRLHGWAGHLARLPPSSPVVRVLRLRSLAWWRGQQEWGNRKDSRHHRPGRFARWGTPLELFDPEWFTLAQDRSAWRLLSFPHRSRRTPSPWGPQRLRVRWPPHKCSVPSFWWWPALGSHGSLASHFPPRQPGLCGRQGYLGLCVLPSVWRSAGYLGVLPRPALFCTAYHTGSSELQGPSGSGLASPAHASLRCGR